MSKYPSCPDKGNVESGGWMEPGWQSGVLDVDGNFTSDSATIPPTIYQLPAPSKYIGKWIDNSITHQSKGQDKRLYRYRGNGAFRYTLNLQWGYQDIEGMHEVLDMFAAFIKASDNVVLLYPHYEVIDWYFLMNVVDHNLHQYLNGSPIGYEGLYIQFEGATSYTEIQTFDPMAIKMWCDESVGGPYAANDPHLTHWCDESVGGPYTDEEYNHKLGIWQR